MTAKEYLAYFQREIHTVTACTIGSDGKPTARVIDLALADATLYFLTARGTAFSQQLKEQKFVAIAGEKNGVSISLRGAVRPMGHSKLEEIFAQNPRLSRLYPPGRRDTVEVFQLYSGQGELFDLSDPAHIRREPFMLGGGKPRETGYFITGRCEGCRTCVGVCPQDAIDFTAKPLVIRQNRCLHCGSCFVSCPYQAIEKRD